MNDRLARLGELERRVLDWLWGRDWVDVRAVHAADATTRRRSPNTIHSTLERLIRKGLVERRRAGRGYAYRTIVSRDDFVGQALAGAIEQMPGGDSQALLAAFVDVAARIDAEALDELERLVRARRRAREDVLDGAPTSERIRARDVESEDPR